MKNSFFLLIVMLFMAFVTMSQNKQEMKPAKKVRTYNTAGMEKKKVSEKYTHEVRKTEIKVISKEKFERYPPKKRQAILSEPEKYIIED